MTLKTSAVPSASAASRGTDLSTDPERENESLRAEKTHNSCLCTAVMLS